MKSGNEKFILVLKVLFGNAKNARIPKTNLGTNSDKITVRFAMANPSKWY